MTRNPERGRALNRKREQARIRLLVAVRRAERQAEASTAREETPKGQDFLGDQLQG
jgi:hypothetical protein